MKPALRRVCSIGPITIAAAIVSTVLLFQPVGLAAQTQSAKASAGARTRSAKQEVKFTPELRRKLIQQKIKYVFVLYQENRSFDSYFGTFPGADGLFSHPAKQTPGFYQRILNVDGTTSMIHPFRIGPNEFAADTDDVDHSHPGLYAKMDIQSGSPRMDRFALAEEMRFVKPGAKPSLRAKQFGELTMAYEDCDTIPLLWRYASRFVLFDHIFQEMVGPSTPGNLAILAAQTGQTQWVLHPNEAASNPNASAAGVPVLNDRDPLWGSPADPTPKDKKMPVNPHDFQPGRSYGTQINLTYASVPLTLQGEELKKTTEADRDPDGDLDDVKDDVEFISKLKQKAIPFGWYEEGYDREPTDDAGPVDAMGMHASYITHHNGPQYFGYISNNPKMRSQLHGLDDFFTALRTHSLPSEGGLFYVKGGFRNIFGWKPTDPDPKVRANFLGDDDHPAYSDAQISEAMVAEAINAIAASPYWRHSAIIITWDDSEGDYDHLPPRVRARGPDHTVISDGPRVPLILISPYARMHFVAHEPGNHASVVKFVDEVFGLTPLAKLPDEQKARTLGKKLFGQDNLGPEDAETPGISDLLQAFDPARLDGRRAPLSAAYAEVPEYLVRNLPATTGYGCTQLGMVTVDRRKRIKNEVPADFNPRPTTNPTTIGGTR